MTEGANELMKAAGDFIAKVVNVPLQEVGGLFADRVKLFRAKNWIKDYKILDEYSKKHGVKLRQIPLKTLMPMLDGMTIEEEPDLKQKWRALFINTAKENSKVNTPVFSKILSELSAADAATFNDFARSNMQVMEDGNQLIIARIGGYRSQSSPSLVGASFYNMDNLVRLRLIAEDTTRFSSVDTPYFYITEMGQLFFAAVWSDIE